MAFKKVVEILGENLESLLELAKKWLFDWAINAKKLLHTLHNIRKEDLNGLISGTHEIKVKQQSSSVIEGKFALIADLGVITVPDDYVHGKELSSLNRKKFLFFNPGITDEHFPNPSCILKPGKKLWVRAFKQNSLGTTTSVERMEFLSMQNAIYTGAQGVSLVYKQKRSLLPKGRYYCSFDEKDCLFKNVKDNHCVPGLIPLSNGGFKFIMSTFEIDWDPDYVVLCFNEVPAGS